MKISMILIIILLSSTVVASQSEKIYFLNLEYDKGTLELIELSLITGYPTISNDDLLPYKLELLSIDKEIIYQGYFDVPNKFFAPPPLDPNEVSDVFELENLNFSISLPYNQDGNTIILSKNETELLQIDVSEFSIYCGDSICHLTENKEECPQDCSDIVISNSSKKSWQLLTSLGVLVLLILIGIFYKISSKKNMN
jgi:hypothetical protein